MGNNPWTYIGLIILISVGSLTILSLLASFMIALFSGRHAQKTTQAVIQKIQDRLPGTDCGECGCKTCREYAVLVLNQEVVTPCPGCTQAVTEELEGYAQDFWKLTEQEKPELPKGWRKFGS